MKPISFAVLAVASALALTPAAHAADATSAQILSAFNAERVANGIPGGVTENPTLSQDCALHNHYMAVNRTLTHDEATGAPAYTSAGAFAGQNAVLSAGTTWLRADPWLNAPIHLDQVMSPLLQTAGVAESENFNCFTTFIGYDQDASAPTDELFSFPGNGGSAPYAQTAYEAPHTPGEWVGLPSGTETGPYLIIYWRGVIGDPNLDDDVPPPGWDPNNPSYVDPTPPQDPLSLLSAATVTGPDGAVAVDVLNTATHNGDGYYLAPNSGFVLPVHPLRPNATYQVAATFSTDPTNPYSSRQPRSWTGSFSFHTTDQALTLLGPAGKPTTPARTQTPTTQHTRAASALHAPATVVLHRLRHGRLAVSVRLASAPAHVRALLAVGHRALGFSRVIYARHAGRITLTLMLEARGLRRLLRHGSLHTVVRVIVRPRSARVPAVELDNPLTVDR